MKTWGERVKRTTNPTMMNSDVYLKNNRDDAGFCPLPEGKSSDDTEQLKQTYFKLRSELQQLETELKRRGVF